ncbi:MAG: NADH-quinone oxidoreductase subunit N, partial [Gammaproteobacteria bacterium]
VAALVIGSVIGLFYYLRIVAVMYGQEKGLVLHVPAISPAGSLLLAVLTLLLLWLGVYPASLMRVIQAMVLNIV